MSDTGRIYSCARCLAQVICVVAATAARSTVLVAARPWPGVNGSVTPPSGIRPAGAAALLMPSVPGDTDVDTNRH